MSYSPRFPNWVNCRHKSSSCPSNHRTRPSEQSHRELGAIAKFAVDRVGAAVLLLSRTLGPRRRRRTRVVTFKATRNNRAYEFSSGELAEQAPRGKKINSFKAFGEPFVNPFQQLDGLPLAALIGP